MVLDEAALGLAHPGSDPQLCELLEHHAQQQLRRLPGAEDFSAEVRRVLGATLRRGDARISAVAKELAMSGRSLQRRLNAEGSSFREELDRVRSELAVRLLSEGEADVREVAYLLGFSEPSAFHRAFKRWTGTTPAAYRNHQA